MAIPTKEQKPLEKKSDSGHRHTEPAQRQSQESEMEAR